MKITKSGVRDYSMKTITPGNLKFFMVMKPNADSEIGDILFKTDIRALMLMAKGGLNANEVMGAFLDELPAKHKAQELMKEVNASIQESFENADERKAKEDALQNLLGDEGYNVKDLDDESLDAMLQKVVDVNSIDESAENVIRVMRLLNSSERDIIEAMSHHLGMHFKEAKEVYKEKMKG